MCGICGVVALAGSLPRDDTRERIRPMLDALYHRGPDEAGYHLSDLAVLGVTRLAIRAIASGTQPLVDPATGVVVVCNGEIDNHRELRAWLEARGHVVPQATDVAVIPGLYLELGEAFVERLIGMFALAVWDPRRRQLLLARDRAGERSLFYTERGGQVLFASEIAALTVDRSLPLLPHRDALQHYLQFGIFTSPTTPLAGIQRVGPAEAVIVTPSGARRSRYWRWTPVATADTASAADTFDGIFRDAVRRQSDVDVDYGLFLSGGLDSSLVLSVAQQIRHRPRLKTYTLRFDEPSFDESDYARQIAERADAEHIPVWVRAADMPAGIASLLRLVGEPLADPAWVPTALLARRAVEDVKMVLVGEGADELFGGYPTYLGATLGARYAQLPGPLKALVRKAVLAWPVSDRKVAVSYLLKRFVEAEGLNGLQRHLSWTSTIPPATLQRLGVKASLADAGYDVVGDLLDGLQRHDLETSLAEGLLTKADRASMTSSLELRAPFLDVAVMEYAATLPVAQRVGGLSTKVFLKSYATRYLPASHIYRRKRGLSVPLATWLRGPLHEWARSRLAGDLLGGAGLDSAVALTLLDEHQQRVADHARPLWTLLVLAEWFAWLAEQNARRGGEVPAVAHGRYLEISGVSAP
ncbi:MAG: asparagine synthase (glutamine-hydrolyzing) [Lentisphaerae bacterium]|nr:asparagine synthase (glutamine-hydrolyzing) [Lentisphaerota bacterium]